MFLPGIFPLALSQEQLEKLHALLCEQLHAGTLDEALHDVHDGCAYMIQDHNERVLKARAVSRARWN